MGLRLRCTRVYVRSHMCTSAAAAGSKYCRPTSEYIVVRVYWLLVVLFLVCSRVARAAVKQHHQHPHRHRRRHRHHYHHQHRQPWSVALLAATCCLLPVAACGGSGRSREEAKLSNYSMLAEADGLLRTQQTHFSEMLHVHVQDYVQDT